jgi:uncharacterized membrane protein YjfL (UPF0719 family)
MTYGLQVALYFLLAFALCWVGKRAFALCHPRLRLDVELTAKDNLAFAVPLGGYYLGLLIVMGAPLSGPSRGHPLEECVAIAAWGLLGIVLLNLASLTERQILLRQVDLLHEILERRNLAAGIVLGGFHLASALLVLGALGDEGGLRAAALFWLYAQVLLALSAWIYLRVAREDLAAEIGRGNCAVALSLGGVLVAMGNILRLAISGPFEGWTRGFTAATSYALAGLALLFAARWLTDWLLLPGVTIRQEVLEQEVPNVGVGLLEAVFYLGASFLIAWTL